MQRTSEEKEVFYEKLRCCLPPAQNDPLIILGDFNARVGQDYKSWPDVIGKHGVGKMNSNGLMLLEFCTRLQLSVMGTTFQLKDSLKNTWQHLRSKHWHQLDHVLANQAAKPFIKVTKVNQAADCFTDHKLLVSNCAFPLKRKRNISRPLKKLNTRLNDDKKAKLVQFLDEKIPASSFDFEELQDILQQAANHVFEKKKRIQNDWFDDQDDEIRNLLQDKSLDRHSLRTRIRQIKDAWFQKKAEEAEHFSQTKNPREFYATLNAVYGPRSRNSHPVRSKDGILLADPMEVKGRWVEHFSDLLNLPSDVDLKIVDELDQLPIMQSMDDPVTDQELEKAISNTKLGKSPGSDGVLPEVIVYGGRCLRAFLLILFNIIWASEMIPQVWKDAIITILFKKGDRSECGNYRGISLLSVVGKIFADIILQRLQLLAEFIYPQSQSGYRAGRGTIDGIFTLRQLMEKTREQRNNMYIVFVDFVKAFDTVNRELLFSILGKLGCPPKLIRIIKKLYSDVHARLIVDGELTQAFEYNCGVKQGCKLAPTLFGIYAAVLLWLAFKKIEHTCSIQTRFRFDGNLFDLRRLKAKTKVLTEFIREAKYADDIALFSDTPEGLQSLLTSYNQLAKRMGMRINTKKTETMCIGNTADFYVDGIKLVNVPHFKYLGSILSSDCSMRAELTSRIQAVSCAYGRLRKRVFDSRDLTVSTKIAVYNQCLMPLLLYGSESWTVYQHEVRELRTLQQRHLRLILKIRWDDYISNEDVLRRANVDDIETKLVRSRLRWLGHLCRMDDDRVPKQLLFSELEHGSRLFGRPKLRFKDILKKDLKIGSVFEAWCYYVHNRKEWRAITDNICTSYDKRRYETYSKRRDARRKRAKDS